MRRLLALPIFALLAGCGASPTPPPAAPVATVAPAPEPSVRPAVEGPPKAPADPFALGAPPTRETISTAEPSALDPKVMTLGPLPKGVPAPPATCGAFVKRKAAKAPKCAGRAEALAALDLALAEPDASKRDGALVGVEACADLPPGFVRALRAELATTECADAIVEPLLKAPPQSLGNALTHTLVGEALAGRLARTVRTPPKLAPPFDKKRVLEFVKGPLAAWMGEQASAIEQIAKAGAMLESHGRGLVAIEAGMADMRFVEAVRSVPLPTEFAHDEELKSTYYAMLDQALDPRKDRGRDAALVGLREYAVEGSLSDGRIDEARALLSKLYGGRRIDALDAVELPRLAPATPSSVEEKLATKLPTFYAGLLLDASKSAEPRLLRALVEKGVPAPVRATLASGELSPEVRRLYARARIRLGQRYWRAVDFDEAAALASGWPSDKPRPDDVALVLGVALALRGGPVDAVDMMRKAPLVVASPRNVAALDAIASAGGPLAGVAAFDAAIALQTTPPEKADAAYWNDVARRFRDAATRLSDPATRAAASDRAASAEATAKAIQ